MRRRPIEPDFAYVPGFRQECAQLMNLILTRRNELWMKTNCYLHPRRVAN